MSSVTNSRYLEMHPQVLSLIHPDYIQEYDDDTASLSRSSSSSPMTLETCRLSNEEKYETEVPCRFEYIRRDDLREMLASAWQAITVTNNWRFILETDLEMILWSSSPNTNAILLQIHQNSSYEHSGSSFCYVMKSMKYIAYYGGEKFKENYLQQS